MSTTVSTASVLPGQLLVSHRFESKVQRGDGCWEWTGELSKHGYGKFWQEKRYHPAHRIAYQFVHGPLPKGIYVCHTCDNRKCVRPDHLFAGTHADNMRDMAQKGRAVSNAVPQPGESNPAAVLTERDVELIISLVAHDVPQKVAAEVFRVSVSEVSDIVRGNRWRKT